MALIQRFTEVDTSLYSNSKITETQDAESYQYKMCRLCQWYSQLCKSIGRSP